MRKSFFTASWIVLALGALASPALAQSTARDNQVDNRLENQQDRIAQGIQSGQLTPREAARLERREGRVNRLEARQEARNGGDALTGAQQRRDDRILNRDSRAIYRHKHNSHRFH